MTLAGASEQALAGALLASGDEIGRRLNRIARQAAYLMVASLCLVSALGCALAGLWIYAAREIGTSVAPLVVAGVLVVIAMATLLALRLRLKPVPRRTASGFPAAELIAELPALVRANKTTTLAAALIAGFAAGAAPR